MVRRVTTLENTLVAAIEDLEKVMYRDRVRVKELDNKLDQLREDVIQQTIQITEQISA